jgi:hypothetical protein
VGIGFGALYALGVTGFSAAGITSGLATAGALIGGGMAAGVGVLAAPAAIAGVVGYGLFAKKKNKKLLQAKGELLRSAITKRDAIIKFLGEENEDNKERLDYLNSLNFLLNEAVSDLTDDLTA